MCNVGPDLAPCPARIYYLSFVPMAPLLLPLRQRNRMHRTGPGFFSPPPTSPISFPFLVSCILVPLAPPSDQKSAVVPAVESPIPAPVHRKPDTQRLCTQHP